MAEWFDLRKNEDLNSALRELVGCWKLWSGCVLRGCGLPTLPGMIVAKTSSGFIENAKRLLDQLDAKAALIRHDKRRESPPHPRGGFLVGIGMIEQAVQYLLELGRIVALYEPADPLLNGYNMNLLFESERKVTIEIVGPGFDASDLQRGDLSPHESFSARLSKEGAVSNLQPAYRVDEAGYKESVTLRKEKLRRKFESSPSPSLARRIREDLGIPNDLDDHLRAIGSPLSVAEHYEPIPKSLMSETIRLIVQSNIIKAYCDMTGVSFPLNFSTSFVHKGTRQVFWDIVSPQLKFQGLSGRGGAAKAT